jgi:hypothetical protein
MMQVASSIQPVEVDPSGKRVIITADDGDGNYVTCEDFDGPLDFDVAVPAPSIDKFDIDAGSGSNTVVYNDFKDVAQRLAGPCLLRYLHITLSVRACAARRTCYHVLLSFRLPFHRNPPLLHYHLLHDFLMLSPSFQIHSPFLPHDPNLYSSVSTLHRHRGTAPGRARSRDRRPRGGVDEVSRRVSCLVERERELRRV